MLPPLPTRLPILYIMEDPGVYPVVVCTPWGGNFDTAGFDLDARRHGNGPECSRPPRRLGVFEPATPCALFGLGGRMGVGGTQKRRRTSGGINVPAGVRILFEAFSFEICVGVKEICVGLTLIFGGNLLIGVGGKGVSGSN